MDYNVMTYYELQQEKRRLIKEHNKNCNHDRKFCKLVKQKCKICYGDKKQLINRVISNSKNKDLRFGIYDKENFITKEFLEELIKKSNDLCYYCNYSIQYLTKNSSLCSIDRINDLEGHTKNNVVLSCLYCNSSKTRINGTKDYMNRHKYLKLVEFIQENFNITDTLKIHS